MVYLSLRLFIIVHLIGVSTYSLGQNIRLCFEELNVLQAPKDEVWEFHVHQYNVDDGEYPNTRKEHAYEFIGKVRIDVKMRDLGEMPQSIHHENMCLTFTSMASQSHMVGLRISGHTVPTYSGEPAQLLPVHYGQTQYGLRGWTRGWPLDQRHYALIYWPRPIEAEHELD